MNGCTEVFSFINHIDLADLELLMPCAYHINLEEALVTVTSSLEVSLPETAGFGVRLRSDPEFSPKLPQLVNLRGLMRNEFAATALSKTLRQ